MATTFRVPAVLAAGAIALSSILPLVASATGVSGDGVSWELPGEDIADDPALSEFLDDLASDASVECALDEMLRRLAAFRDNPVDINTAGVAELSRVPFLGPGSAVRIVADRRALGPFPALDDLVERRCLDSATLEVVRPYIVAVAVPDGTAADGRASAPSEDASGLVWDFRARLAFSEGYEESWATDTFSAWAAGFSRLRVSLPNGLSVGLAGGKDKGEERWHDHVAACLSWRARDTARLDAAVVRSACMGDFTGSWGQGLTLRSGTFSSASSYPRRTDGLRAYDGAGESAPRRGVFLELARGRASVTAVAALTRLDASIDDDGLVTSVRTSGYHRTESEETGAGALEERLLGGRIRLAVTEGLRVGGSVLGLSYKPGFAEGDPERQRFGFSGDGLGICGLDLLAGGPGADAGLEVARTSSGGVAILGAARIARGRARVHAGAARVSRDYTSPLGGGVPGYSGGTNGTSAWAGVAYRARAGWKLSAEMLVRRRPWRSYLLELPDRAVSLRASLTARLGRRGRLVVDARRRYAQDEEGDPASTVRRSLVRTGASLNSGGSSSCGLSVTRVVSLLENVEEGSLLALGVKAARDVGCSTSVDGGITSVVKTGNTPSLVRYEPRLPGEFGLRSLNASGTRWYIRVQVKGPFGSGLTFRLGGGPGKGRTEMGIGIDARG